MENAYKIGCLYGLAAMEALHIAAALSVGAEEFVTTEKQTKPMHLLYKYSSYFNASGDIGKLPKD